jgi:hypothetical protein
MLMIMSSGQSSMVVVHVADCLMAEGVWLPCNFKYVSAHACHVLTAKHPWRRMSTCRLRRIHNVL